MFRKITLSLLTAGLFILLTSGCTTNPEQSAFNQTRGFNLAGIVQYEEGKFGQRAPASLSASTRDFAPRGVFTGDRVSLLWGLITIDDY